MVSTAEDFLRHLADAKKSSANMVCRCPAHDDQRASLSISRGREGRILLNCHAGCDFKDICAAAGITKEDLMVDNCPHPDAQDKDRFLATYDYRDREGKLSFQVVRMRSKDFRARKPDSSGNDWIWNRKDTSNVPYRLPELMAEPDRTVIVVEGEKDVDNLAKLNCIATCNAGGAGKWNFEHASYLLGRDVIIIPDNDEPGRKHAQKVAQSLDKIAKKIRILELPDLPEKGDVSDWIAGGGTAEQLNQMIAETPLSSATLSHWPDLIPFQKEESPSFPTEVLPDELRDWVEAESRATQTPADLPGLLSLAVCAACIARRVNVIARKGWVEPTNLFVAVLLEPGNRKSAVFSDALRPLREYERELIDEARPMIAFKESIRRQKERRLNKLEKAAAENNDVNAAAQAEELSIDLAQEPIPVLPKFIIDDATSEKLGITLAEQDGRIASMSPEGGVFDLMSGLYAKGGASAFSVYLMGHSGDDLVTDRVTRNSIFVKRPALTCAYAIQPAVIEGLASNKAFRGRGLLGRFLYAAPESWIGNREIAPPEVQPETSEAYRKLVRRLVSVDEYRELVLDDLSRRTLQSWEGEIETMLGDGGQMELLRDWGGKLAGATVRLAGILHCVSGEESNVIGEKSMIAAIAIARYLIPHAEKVLQKMAANAPGLEEDAQYLLRWVRSNDQASFTRRDAHQACKARFPKVVDIDPALEELERRGFILEFPSPPPKRGRQPSPVYDVRPV